MRKTSIAAALAAVSLTACATATPYQPNIPGNSTSGGFSELRLSPNRFRVTFAGNSLTSRQTVETYLLYRAAELTAAQGYDWFSTIDQDTERQTRVYGSPDPFYPGGLGYRGYGGWGGRGLYWHPSWRYYGGGYGWRSWGPYGGDPFFNGVDIHTVTKYEANADIIMGRGPTPGNDPRALNAREVLSNLGPNIQRPA